MLNVFSADPEVIGWLLRVLEALPREGLGASRGAAEFLRVEGAGGRVTLDLSPQSAAPGRVCVEFLSATELKHGNGIAPSPEFPILFGRARDRVSTLSRLYGERALDIDYDGSTRRAAGVRMVSCHLRREETERRSSRTGQRHRIGGVTGTAEYEGELGEFLPWLEAARHTGVGRQAVWGKGEISIRAAT